MHRLRTWRRSQGSHFSETWTQYAVQSTQCIKQLSSWCGKTFWKKSGKLFRGRDLILMKLKPHVSLAGSSTNSPFWVFCPPKGQKLLKHDKNKQGSRHSLFECVHQIWGLYIIFMAMYADKWLWPIFGCKVGQSLQIGMKLELDVWHHQLDVYAKFQTDISKHVQKSPGSFSLAGSSSNTPFKCFCPPEGQKLPNHDGNQ